MLRARGFFLLIRQGPALAARALALALLAALLTVPGASALAGQVTLQGEQPGVITIDVLANLYGPVQFGHSMHTFIEEKCQTCHHQHGNTPRRGCTGCHDIAPEDFRRVNVNSFIACRACHATVADPDNPGMPSLQVAYHRKCLSCHNGMAGIGTTPEGCTKTCHAKAR